MRFPFLLRVAQAAVLAAVVAVPGKTLREAADPGGILIGTAVRPSLFSETAYAETLGREFNLVEPEDVMKWPALRPSAEVFDFREGDEVVRFARAHRMKVRGHCLVWDHNNPEWLARGTFTSDQLSQLLREHIFHVMQHYSGQVFAWDVVNEGFDENGRLKDSPWYNAPGIGLAGKGAAYIEQAFRWAREADPEALLFYNEADAEEMNRKSDAVYAMVKDFKLRGVPIDGVGLQMHVADLDFDGAGLTANIRRLTALGLQVHITELDVSLPLGANGKVQESDLARQAEIYRAGGHACLENRRCTAIQTWGFTDKYSWIGWHSGGKRGAALPFDRAYRPKAAYDAVWSELTTAAARH